MTHALSAHELKNGDRILFKSPFDPTLSPLLRRRSVKIIRGKPYVQHKRSRLEVLQIRPERINSEIKIWEVR